MKQFVLFVLCGVLVGAFASRSVLAAGDRAAVADSDTLLKLLGDLADEQLSPSPKACPAPEPAPKPTVPPPAALPPSPAPAISSPEPEQVPEPSVDVISDLADELESDVVPEPLADGVSVTNALATVSVARAERPTKITSRTAVYNRKEGLASFSGAVHLDDSQYQLHADRAFVFTTESNEVKRVVAIGHVAMTNEQRCAYGAKVTYSRPNGLVVLYSGEGIAAEVVDNSKGQPQVVKGEKIRFWIDSEQVEVLKADISGPAPAGTLNADALKNIKGK